MRAGDPMTNLATFDDDRAAGEASAWLARLQREDLTEADGLEFDAWIAVTANREAYGQLLGLWHEFEAGGESVLADLVRLGRDRGPTRRLLVGGGAGGLAIAAGLAVAILPGLRPDQPTVMTFATGKGERQRLKLADGSVLDLNAETKLSVSLSRTGRRVVLSEGEAIFDVAHEADRPFTVAAASRVVQVVGTQFDVRSRRGELAVTVASGRVQVRPVPGTNGRTFLLTPGQRLEIAAAGGEALTAVDPQEAFSWRAGRLVYRGAPLVEVVEDLNRQYAEQIEIADAALGQMPITGVIVLDDQQAVVARLSLMLPIRSVPSERGLLLLKK